ncbi:arginyl-tRNA synthetase [Xylariales sp. AK1849]|nr:arginyl-tRNA synthetase [Xylariales sp. AK1849]
MATLNLLGLEGSLGKLGLETPIPDCAQAEVLVKPIDIYRSYLADRVSKLLECDAALAYEAIQNANTKDNGDLALVLAKLRLKNTKPKEAANEALPKFTSTPLFTLPFPDGVHLRFLFSSRTLPQLLLPYINDRGPDYGRDPSHGRRDPPSAESACKKVVVEFSSPNLASEFNAAHLRSTIIGMQISQMYAEMGWDVVRLNYLGDWGKQLGLLAAGWQRFGSEEALQENPMGHLLEVFEKIEELFRPEQEASRKARDEGHDTAAIESQGIYAERDAFFKRMEDSDPEALGLWKRFRDVSIDYYTKTYARLNVVFDEYSGESQVNPESITEVESLLKEKGIYEESEGSWIIDFKKHGPKNLGTAVVRGRTGSTTYLLRDVAAVLDREKSFSFDKMVYVVTSEQESHFHRVLQMLEFIGRSDLAAKLQHVAFGKVQGMSAQLGKVHLLGDILDQASNAMQDVLGTDQEHHSHIENTDVSAYQLGITALIAQDGLSRRATGYTFNTGKLASFEGETGPYIQESYGKLCAVLTGSELQEDSLATTDYSYLQEEPWSDVLRVIAQYPDVTSAAFKAHEPSLILNYLFRLVEEVSNCLDDDDDEDEGEEGEASGTPVEPEPPEAVLAYATLYRAARQVLKNGMAVLGLTPVVSRV